jgi:heme a synthase
MISSRNRITDKIRHLFPGLVLLTIITVYLLILAGGIVRGTGSGMGCPDWPRCFGRWIPPTEASQLPPNYQQIYGAKLKGEVEFNAVKTWIEYINRLLGAFSGLLVFTLLLSSLTYFRRNTAVFVGSLAAFVLIGANGWLGSRVVATELADYLITLHLLLAVLVVFALLFVYVRIGKLNNFISPKTQHITGLNWLLGITIVLSLGQVILGTQVRDALDGIVKTLGYAQRDNWMGVMDWHFYVHRSFSLVILGLHLWVIYQLRKMSPTGKINPLIGSLLGVVVAEIATGAVMAYFSVPAAAQPIHLFLAVVMLGLQFVAFLLLNQKLEPQMQFYNNGVWKNQSA